MGMFISRDPIGLMGGDNVFQYAPNPVNWVDPLGLLTYPSRQQAIKNLGITPAVRAQPVPQGKTIPAQYSSAQKKLISKEWNRTIQNDINQHLAAGRMSPCPNKNLLHVQNVAKVPVAGKNTVDIQ